MAKTLTGGVSMGAKKTVPRGRPPLQPKKTAEEKLSKTLQGIKRRNLLIKKKKTKKKIPSKPKTAAQKLLDDSRAQYLQREVEADEDALGGWE